MSKIISFLNGKRGLVKQQPLSTLQQLYLERGLMLLLWIQIHKVALATGMKKTSVASIWLKRIAKKKFIRFART